MKDIIIRGRYNTGHILKYIEDNLYTLENCLYYRTIMDTDGKTIRAVDPDAGPYREIGDKIKDKEILSFTEKDKKLYVRFK